MQANSIFSHRDSFFDSLSLCHTSRQFVNYPTVLMLQVAFSQRLSITDTTSIKYKSHINPDVEEKTP